MLLFYQFGIIVCNASNYMRKLSILLSFCLIFFYTIAQKDKSTNAIPITKEDALKFTTLNQVLGIPSTYHVESYKVIYNLVDTPEKHREARTRVSTQDISYLFRGTVSGDVVTFTQILLKKGDRQIKLEDKVYVIK
jgi:hypothetical protein